MTKDELDNLMAQRTRAHELTHQTSDPDKSRAYAKVVKDLDAEIIVAQQEVKQSELEDTLRKRMRAGYAGTDQAFDTLWETSLKAETLKQHMFDSAGQHERENAELARKMISGDW